MARRMLSELWFSILLICVYSMPYQVPLNGNVGGLRTLIIIDDYLTKQYNSIFFDDLIDEGFIINFIHSNSTNLKLMEFNNYLYDNIILIAPQTNQFAAISFKDLLHFIDNGGNMLVVVDDKISKNMRNFAEACGIDFLATPSKVVDHFSYLNTTTTKNLFHTNILTTNVNHLPITNVNDNNDSENETPILYDGIAHVVEKNNTFSIKVLRGHPTMSHFIDTSLFSGKVTEGYVPPSETQAQVSNDLLLISAIQARNNARVAFIGSTSFLSNQVFTQIYNENDKTIVGNRVFIKRLVLWVCRLTGIIRFSQVSHSRTDGSPPDVVLHDKDQPDLPITLYSDPEIARNSLVYRIRDEILYSLVVHSFVNGSWEAICFNDMQLEFVMLNPYIRKTMTCDAKTGKHSALFVAPDDYGVFKFRVLYRRLNGYNAIHSEDQVSLRPFKQNEYERFILAAAPYYVTAISSMVAFFIFCVIFYFQK